jgi:excisionase family DNA binding protein
VSYLGSLSPASRHELEQLIDARIEAALRIRRPERRWVSVREAANLLGISERAVRGRVARGRIGATHQGRSIVIDMHSLNGSS